MEYPELRAEAMQPVRQAIESMLRRKYPALDSNDQDDESQVSDGNIPASIE